MGTEGRKTAEDCLDNTQWNHSQMHEGFFWHYQAEQGNIEQKQRNHYYRNLLEDGCEIAKDFFQRSFLDSVIVDVGSGPEGILHVLHAQRKFAVDPLMDKFAEEYDVWNNSVEAICARGEDFELPEKADIALCLNAIDHCQNPQLVIANIWDNMKPAGELLLITDLRKPDECDCYHKLCITESNLHRWLDEYFDIWLWHNFPHQAGNPIRQLIARCVKPC